MEEIWKDIGIIEGVDYTGLYQVSNLGNVKSLYDGRHKKFRELIITPRMVGWGYLQVTLSKDGKRKQSGINRLVAIAFIPIPEELKHIPIEQLQVNHKDEDKTNNCVWNLEWCDCQYNSNYGTRNKRMSEANTNGKCSKSVLQINKNTNEVLGEFPSTMEVQRQLGFKNSHISACCRGEENTAYGYKWQYKINE